MPQDVTGYMYTQHNPPTGWDPRLHWVLDGPVNPYAAVSYLSSVLLGSANFHQLVRSYS